MANGEQIRTENREKGEGKMSYTKGPWRTTVFDDGDIFVEGRDYNRAAICKMLPPCGHYTHGETGNKIDVSAENRLNAALIAAAPEMLNLLHEMNDRRNDYFGITDSCEGGDFFHNEIRAVIAKAEGRE